MSETDFYVSLRGFLRTGEAILAFNRAGENARILISPRRLTRDEYVKVFEFRPTAEVQDLLYVTLTCGRLLRPRMREDIERVVFALMGIQI